MKSYLKRNGVFLFVAAVILILCVVLTGLTVSESASAQTDSFNQEDTVSIGHITDTHYYPFRLCYTEGEAIDTEDEYYFYNYIMSKSTKMWLEAEAIFDKALENFLVNTPDYIVLSGDVGQDGELLSHIDVANKLRALQNKVRTRTGNDKFQIFVVLGNHDLYNEDTFRFDNATGTRETHLYTTRIEAVQIYAGLGYPNMTEEEATLFYEGLSADLPAGYTFVRSDLSSDFNYTWEFLTKNGTQNRVYHPDQDNADEITLAKMLNQGIVKTIDNTAFFRSTDMCYTYETKGDGTDLDIGQMTFIAQRVDGQFSFVGMDVVLSNADEGHVLGGQLQNETQEWMTENSSFARPYGAETLVTGSAHHSILPHWEMEEEITTGFIVYNWVEVSDFLADYGMRYVYTGHMHANDTVSKISFNGNQIIDMESSANVSVGSHIKITEIKTGNVDGVYAEKAFLSAYANETLHSEKLFDKVFAGDKYGYVARNKVGEFLNYNTKTITDYSSYARRRIYDNVLENYIAEFLRPTITNKLGDLVAGLSFSLGSLNVNLGNFSADIVTLANNLISEVNGKILADYTYKGTTERYKAADMKIFGFLEEMVYKVAHAQVGEDATMLSVFMDCYVRHCTGEDWASVSDMPATHQALLKQLTSGEFVDFLFETLLDRETGLMKIIVGLSETTLDLSKGISSDFKSTLNLLMGVLGVKNFSLAEFNLGEIVKAAVQIDMVNDLISGLGVEIDLVNNTIPEVIDEIVFKYLTDNFKQSLGEYAAQIMASFGSDGGHIDVLDDNGGNGTLITVYDGEEYTFIDKKRTEIVTVDNGKKPSMLTNNFGSDPSTTRNFTYFTDRRVTDGAIQYTTDVKGKTGATTVNATTQIYGTTKPLIDLGIWCQTGYTEYSRHTVELEKLEPGTTYAYRVGSPSKGYWSDWYTFTTGTADGTFEVLIASDLQSSTRSAYQRIDKIYSDILNRQFSDGLDFIINPGDVVDNARNLSQFTWFINSSDDVYASYPMVVAAGNHDAKYFEFADTANVDYYGGASANAYTGEYNYLWSHFNYELTSAQTQKSGFYYSFDYSDVHFVVLNTNDIEVTENADGNDTYGLGKTQYEWLVKDLTDTSKKYKVVIMHKSLYSEGSHSYDKDVVGMRAQLTPLFAEKGVNLVLAGHDHVYNETFYLDGNGNKISTNANGKNEIGTKGTLYVTMGTLGEKFYNYVDNPSVPTNTGESLHTDDGKLADPTFGKLVFDGEKLYYYGYQYVREYSSDGAFSGGSTVDIDKKMDINLIIALCLVGVVAVATVIAVITAAVKNRKR